MRVNTDSLLIRAATTSTSGTLNDLTTALIMANNSLYITTHHPTFSQVEGTMEEALGGLTE